MRTRERIEAELADDKAIRADIERMEQEVTMGVKIHNERIYPEITEELKNSVRRENLLDGSDVALLRVERTQQISEFRSTTVNELYISHGSRCFKVSRQEADRVFDEIVIAFNHAFASGLTQKYSDFVLGGQNA